jgi:hypothetical protein
VNLLKVAETVEDFLSGVSSVKEVDLLPLKEGNKGVRLKVVVSSSLTYELLKEVSNAISEAKWRVFQKTGELPVVEWEIERF